MAAEGVIIASRIAWLNGQPPIVLSLVEMLIILGIVMLLSVTELLVFRYLYHRFKQSNRLWDDVFISAVQRPLQLVILIVGISFCVDIFDSYFANLDLLRFTTFVRKALVIVAVMWAALRFGRQLEQNILNPSRVKKMDQTSAFALNRLFRITIVFVGSIAIMQLIGVPLSALLAFGGAGALAFGFAAKDSLGNFFSGLMLYVEKPFSVGDWIVIVGTTLEGTVEDIGWRSTRLLSFDKRPLSVPNATFSASAVMNCTRMRNRRILTTLTLRYNDNDKLNDICRELREYLERHSAIDHNQAVYVYFSGFGDSSINIYLSAYTLTTTLAEFSLVQQEIFLRVMDIVRGHGADFAFPTQTLDMPDSVKFHAQPAEK